MSRIHVIDFRAQVQTSVRNILASNSGNGVRQELAMIVNPHTSQVTFEVSWNNRAFYHGTSIEQAENCYNNGPVANQPMGSDGIYYGKGKPRHHVPCTVVR